MNTKNYANQITDINEDYPELDLDNLDNDDFGQPAPVYGFSEQTKKYAASFSDWGNPANYEDGFTPLEIIVHRWQWFLRGFRHVAEQYRFWRSAFKSNRKYFGDLDSF